ncbi:MAG: hypothetical protein ACRDHP_11050 [Ktedonobacterales bacterium]
MAGIAQNDLHIEDQAYEAGAAFRLTEPARDDQRISDTHGQTLTLIKGSAYLVVTLPSAPPNDALLTISHETAQRGLDILSAQGDGDYAMGSGNDGALVWWRPDGMTRLRYYTTTVMNFSVGPVTAIVIRSDGTLAPPILTSPIEWHPAFR